MENSQFLNNHDHTRLVTRFGNDNIYRVESAKCFAVLLHTLPGMPYIYQGEEIGMTGVRFNSIEDYHDIAMKNKYKEEVGKGRDPEEVFESLLHLSRDNSRTPVQWDDSVNGGFTEGTPWIKVNPNYKEINIAQALADPDSVFYFYKKLIQLRKENEVMVYGDFQEILEDHEQIYSFIREWDKERWLVVLNISEQQVEVKLPEFVSVLEKKIIITNYKDQSDSSEELNMRPYQAIVYKIL
ncbi:glycosidase [Bacillus sp. SLBN-46]|nr:glycosidase [Bacillus sp. SLBN-46]